MQKKLGRGLANIFKDKIFNLINDIKFCEVDIEEISDNNLCSRKFFDSYALLELSESIKKYGIINPILVLELNEELELKKIFDTKKLLNSEKIKELNSEKIDELNSNKIINNNIDDSFLLDLSGKPKYKLISGSRRLKAAKLINMYRVPVFILDKAEKEQIIIYLIENLQIQELNPIEQLDNCIKLIKDYNCSIEELSILLCKDINFIKDLLNLDNLILSAKQALIDKIINLNHAKYLISLPNQEEIIDYIYEKKLLLQDIDELFKIINNYLEQNKLNNVNYSLKNILKANAKSTKENQNIENNSQNINIKLSSEQIELNSIAEIIAENLGTKVNIVPDGKGYNLNIKINNLTKLDDFLEKICK